MPPSTIAKYAQSAPAELREKIVSSEYSSRYPILPYLRPLDITWLPCHEWEEFLLALKDHPIVKAALLQKLFSVASLDPQFEPASEAPRDQEIAEFTRYGFTRVLSMPETLMEILYPALILKQSVCEMVFNDELHTRGRWVGKRFLKAIKAKRGATLVEDEFGNVTGVKGKNADGEEVTWEGDDLASFFWFKNLPLFGQPTSDFLACCNLIIEYENLKSMRNIHLERYTSPIIDATYSGQGVLENGKKLTHAQALEPRLAALKARGWIMHSDEVNIKGLELATRGEAEFQAALDSLEQKIVLSIAGAFLQTLTSPGGSGDMRGDSSVQASTAQLFVWWYSTAGIAPLNRRAIPYLVDENYAQADYPSLYLGGINPAEALQAATLATTLATGGFPVSIKAVARATGMSVATSPEDTMKVAPAPGGFFSQPAQQQPSFPQPRR